MKSALLLYMLLAYAVLLAVTSKAVVAWSSSASFISGRRRVLASSRIRPSLSLRLASSDEADKLMEQAKQLRQEISSFERKKSSIEQQLQQEQEEQVQEKRALRQRYAAVVPILKPDGSTVQEQCDFEPRFKDNTSLITVCEAALPLGLILGESEDISDAVCIDQVCEGSNGEQAGLQVGDLVRACTACKMEMEQPAWQLIMGGVGIPKTKRFMYSVDGRPFEEVMDAVSSNRMDPEGRPVLLVIERRQES